MEALFPNNLIEHVKEPPLNQIQSYLFLHLCPYSAESTFVSPRMIERIKQILCNSQFNADVKFFLIVDQKVQVSFPERKLNREKWMSEAAIKEILNLEIPLMAHRVEVIAKMGY